MGVIGTVASLANVAANVSRGVFSLAGSGFKMIMNIGKSKLGKLAIGAGAAAILMSNPNNENGSLLSKIGDKFKSFFSSMKDTAVGKMASGALTAVTGVLGFGGAANNVKENVSELASSGTEDTLQGSVASGPETAIYVGDGEFETVEEKLVKNEDTVYVTREQVEEPAVG